MSDVHLTDAQRELYEETLRLPLEPIADAGTPGRVNRPLVRALAEHGLLPRLFERVSAMELCLIREALARHCPDAETAFGVQGLGAYPILQSGQDSVRDEWIPRVAGGTAVAAFALTEADAGSDVRAMEMTRRARRPLAVTGSNGEKLWISNAPEADIYTVFARSARGDHPHSRSRASS